MPATFIVLPALAIGVVAWLAAWWFTRKAKPNPRDELRRLRNHAAWLEQRLDIARQEHWDCRMIVILSDQLGTACQQLADAQRGARRATATSAR